MQVILTKNLKKSYRQHEVVKGISLQVNEGEIFGFLGRNGAGKTTFINMLTGIVKPSGGEFHILGASGKQLDKVKCEVGVLPDYTEFYSNDSALEHLQYFTGLQKRKVTRQQCMDVLEQVGLKNAAYVKTKKYSFGMKKKLGVAQAIIGNPSLIFLDEPTSGMDPESAIEIRHLLVSLSAQKKTIFMTSHNLSEVEKLCTRIAMMKDGVISGLGTVEQLQQQFQAKVEVTIRLCPKSESSYRSAINEIESFCKVTGWDRRYIAVEVADDSDIAAMVRLLCSHGVDIFEVQVNRPSLEEIFMHG
ncbi:ABC transporter ATP-binding protein [Paenibacillus agaridevorans]|uniref:ABC transporter ATP-binding protein n=1 Tax=Paenibacillus agaridevorans TaxID=171404 RepID=UPI001BE4BF7F|nr:ABC transporter ATP-binding protein [Paenibacillus agaridevorans]